MAHCATLGESKISKNKIVGEFYEKLIKVVAVITTIMFAFEFIACSNPSSSLDGTSGEL